MTPSMKIEAVQLEVAAPRQQIMQDAAELQRAVSGGEVDAFVVGRSEDQKRVLMLSDAHLRYEQLVEDMQQGAATVSASGDILFANHSLAAMLGIQLIDLLQSSLASYATAPDRERLATLFSPRAGEPDIEIALARKNGETVAARVSVVSASDDFVTLLITDLSQQRVLAEAEAIVAAIDSGQVDAFVVDGREVVVLEKAQLPDRLLLERQRYRAADARTRAFLGTLAEEFRDILGPMQEAIVALKRKPRADADDERALELLERHGVRLLGLVEDLGKINPKE
jgi:PAS domain S-box-containing protein